MGRQSVIIIESDEHVECWGSLMKICDAHKEFSYLYIRKKKFPFLYKGWKFYKVRWNERQYYAKGKFKDYTV
jgi:hypothetical protein